MKLRATSSEPALATRLTQVTKHGKRLTLPTDYGQVRESIVALLDASRQAVARSVNALMTATYWEIGRRVIEAEQKGKRRAAYGDQLIERLSIDLTERFGRGFSVRNLEQMRQFYLAWPIPQTLSAELGDTLSLPSKKKAQTVSAELGGRGKTTRLAVAAPQLISRKWTLNELAQAFSLPWSAYVRLLSVPDPQARNFYEAEALRGGWSVRQLDRQIDSQFYTRMALSKNKAAMLAKGARSAPQDVVTLDEAVKDPYILEFLDLKDEYSESDLEEALVRRLEDFLLELGGDFTFVGRQRRLRIDQSWFRVDLLLFHRRLRCLVIIDLKLGSLTPGDVGQMHLYCNYAKANWTLEGEGPPVGLILCADKGSSLARYALEGLPNKVMAANYRTLLPDAELLQKELDKARRSFALRRPVAAKRKSKTQPVKPPASPTRTRTRRPPRRSDRWGNNVRRR